MWNGDTRPEEDDKAAALSTRTTPLARLSFIVLVMIAALQPVSAGQWMAADWGGRGPSFAPGSLFWKTNQYRQCPTLYRAILEVDDKPISFAGFRAEAADYIYVFFNGRQIAGRAGKAEGTDGAVLDVDLSHLIEQRRNVLIISAPSDGFSLDGGVAYTSGEIQRFGDDIRRWKAQRFPPLTMLEYEPCMKSDFDDADWASVKATDRRPVAVSDDDLSRMCQRLAVDRLKRLDEDGRWRLKLLSQKGISVVDWEAHQWAGADRLPKWARDVAEQAANDQAETGQQHATAEALTRYCVLADEKTNMDNYVVGLTALKAPQSDVEMCQRSARELRRSLDQMKRSIRSGRYAEAATIAASAEALMEKAREMRAINRLCRCLDNKFGWIDTNAMLANDIADWGLSILSPAAVFASPLSPAALITVRGRELVIGGWSKLKPLRVYKKPARVGPVCLWVVSNGKVTSMRPSEKGIVYERAANGALTENWALLVEDLASGGRLPIELVFLHAPIKIAFKAGEKGVSEVSVSFDRPGAQLFALRPLKEWRGLLRQARVMKSNPLDEAKARRYIEQCRLWSRALLNYPVTFSEVFARDPRGGRSLLIADVYNYRELKDEWGTKPMRIAPLPPLATYGLMMGYPGLEVLSESQVLGSRGVWGDHIAAVGKRSVVYRIPIEPIKRFGGFTSFCFGPTDIGEPGSIKEIETIKRTGANSFRPQHNQTGERAMKTLEWAWEQGIQNVFNTDEKWVPDVCEHFRKLAQQCKSYPPDAVAYDLLNEPETRAPDAYNALIRKVTAAIRESDKTHLIYVEVIPPWGPSARPYPRAAFESLKPTGDKLTCYSFHDYEFRLPPRWPNEERDYRSMLKRWIPAFRFSIEHRRPIHLGEFGGFEQTKQSVYDNPCAITLMMDYFKVFDQFGWHFHYYANRGVVRVRRDGSLRESYVQEAFRRYFARGTFNVNALK